MNLTDTDFYVKSLLGCHSQYLYNIKNIDDAITVIQIRNNDISYQYILEELLIGWEFKSKFSLFNTDPPIYAFLFLISNDDLKCKLRTFKLKKLI